VAREGIPFVVGAIVLAAVFLGLWYGMRWESWRVLGIIWVVLAVFCAYFFRDPDRVAPDVAGAVVSPGDGRVIEVVTEDDPYVGDAALRVSVFLSVFDVHVNRVPVSGVVEAVDYREGKYLMAFNEKASAENEQSHIAIRNERGTVAFKQIAGLIARRIVCRLSPGDTVTVGERFGLIRFGSRVDIVLPPDATVMVKPGDRAKAGETVIGILP